MIKHGILAAGLLLALGGCEKKDNVSAEDRQAAAAAQKEARALEAAQAREKAAAEKAEAKVDIAGENAEAAREKADEATDEVEDKTDKVAADWRGPDEGWDRDWATFAEARDRTAGDGDWVLERGEDGAISTWRKTERVSGDAFAEVKDGALVTQVKSKLAMDGATDARDIDVSAEDHVVTLRGEVGSSAEAAKAVRLALSTPGAEKVISHLKWEKK